MFKASIKYFLSLCIFLLGAQIVLSAQTYAKRNLDVSLKQSPITERFDTEHLQYGQTILTPLTSSGREKKSAIELRENEVEEDELGSSKRHIEVSNYFTRLLNPTTSGDLFRALNKCSLFFKQFSFFSSYTPLHLTLCVIRI